ncbi:sirohydrochlorin chelatase [Galbitalea soli]|uniref:Cobalamin biosynthesis protein CbiX n=1 Tax=Galbitalea soli TaxID=1268042 RepID=A0A7C9PM36_9MICO|nr:CbiX/SirB N-terminal domain-containing protein [Galbitalea soli]NEM90693.1 cobalamin biosynthesis protein CbiX [Galbitalea soli]NYJ31411.1 sirohydrochlorin ferrochelatase [Galbitalea soli]
MTEPAPALAAISHGTSSPTGQAAVAALVAAVAARRPELRVVGGFVDVQQPDVPATLDSIGDGRGAVVVPLLLSAGYHVHVDLSEAVDGATGRDAALANALGPDDRLVAILARRLREAGLRRRDRVVLACAGSSDARAVADCHEMGRRLQLALGRPVRVGFISAATPRLGDAIAAEREGIPAARAAFGRIVRLFVPPARVVVASYLLAPGYFADLARDAGGDVVTEPLLPRSATSPRELVDLVLDRYDAAVRAEAGHPRELQLGVAAS